MFVCCVVCCVCGWLCGRFTTIVGDGVSPPYMVVFVEFLFLLK